MYLFCITFRVHRVYKCDDRLCIFFYSFAFTVIILFGKNKPNVFIYTNVFAALENILYFYYNKFEKKNYYGRDPLKFPPVFNEYISIIRFIKLIHCIFITRVFISFRRGALYYILLYNMIYNSELCYNSI